jgi:hypothetical protein
MKKDSPLPGKTDLLQKNSNEIEQKITAMYAKGMSLRDIRELLTDLYGIDASPETISAISNPVAENFPLAVQAGPKIAAGRKKWKWFSLHLHNLLDTTLAPVL